MCSLQEYNGVDMMGIPGANEVMHQELQHYMVEKTKEKEDEGVGKYYSSSPKRKLEESTLKHAMAERKRRRRINHHYETLRSLLPHLPKRDKPTVLKETVGRVKELKKKVAQYTASSCSLFIPNEKDELIISGYEDKDNEVQVEHRMVKVMICCEDRPGLNKSLSEAMLAAKAVVVKAEMVTIGGRIKAELVLKWVRKDGGGEEDVGMLKRAFKAVLENRAFAASLLFGPRLPNSTNTLHSGHELEPGEYSDTLFDALLF